MANPTSGDVYISQPLTNLSIAYQQTQEAYIADRVFPRVPVQLQAGTYWRYAQGDWFRNDAKPRAPGTESAGGGWKLETDTYACFPYAIHKDIDDQTLANAQVFDLERDATEYVTEQMLLQRELIWADKYFKTGIWGTDLSGVSGSPSAGQFKQWDQAGSTPIEDITAQIIAQTKRTGRRPNVVVLGPEVWATLSNHAAFLDRIKYTQSGVLTEELIAQVFKVERVVVAWAAQNTAAEGATDAYGFIFGKHALLAYAAPNPGLRTPSAGYTFTWAGYLGPDAYSTKVKRFRIEEIESLRVEGTIAFDAKLVAPQMGTLFGSAIA